MVRVSGGLGPARDHLTIEVLDQTFGRKLITHDETIEKLRAFFEVDRHFVVVAALKALMDDGELPPNTVAKALEKYGIDPAKPSPART